MNETLSYEDATQALGGAHVLACARGDLSLAPRVHPRVAPGREATHRLLDAVPDPALLLDSERNILFRNCSARANADALACLRIAYGRACGFVSTATASLNEMWASALAGRTSSAIVVLPGARRRPLLVRVTLGPVDAAVPTESDLLMLLTPPAASAPAAVALQRLFGLTGTEARVLELLLRDRYPREIASELGVSITTIRSHIRALFGKTGTRRQSELATLAWSAG